MINFEIISGPDSNVLTTYQYFQNQIYLGRSLGDLWINDSELFPSHLMLEVVNGELLIHPQKDVEFFLINGKRASQIRKLKNQDIVTIGKTQIKILRFEETPQVSKKEILNEKLSKLMNENSHRLPVIERLTQRMK